MELKFLCGTIVKYFVGLRTAFYFYLKLKRVIISDIDFMIDFRLDFNSKGERLTV